MNSNCHPQPSKLFLMVASVFLPLACVPAQSPLPDDFNPGPDGPVHSLAVQTDGKVLLSGQFNNVGDQPRRGFARLHPDGTVDAEFDPQISSGGVGSIAVQPDGRIVVAGNFIGTGGQLHTNLVRLNANGTVDTTFDPRANGKPSALVLLPDGKLLLGGQFNMIGGQPRSGLARLNADGSLDADFVPPGISGSVYSLAVQPDGRTVVAGFFSVPGGQGNIRLARLDTHGTLDSTFSPTPNSRVTSLVVQPDGKIVVVGFFTQMSGYPRNYVARLDADGSVDLGFDAGAVVANGPYYLSTVALQANGKILIGGFLTRLGGQLCLSVGRLHSDGTSDLDFAPQVDIVVFSLAIQADAKILVAGQFVTVGGQERTCLARLNHTAPAIQRLTYDGSTVTWERTGGGPEIWHATFEQSADGREWTPLGSGTRLPAGWQPEDVSLPSGATLRALGHVTVGGSSWFVETLAGGPIQTHLACDGTNGLLSWTGGFSPYQVQQTSTLGQANVWENIGGPVETNSMRLPVGAGNLFLRVRGQ